MSEPLIDQATLERWRQNLEMKRLLIRLNVLQRIYALFFRPYPAVMWVPPPPGFRWETDHEIRQRIYKRVVEGKQ